MTEQVRPAPGDATEEGSASGASTPESSAPTTPAPESAERLSRPEGALRILVAEDEAIIRLDLAEMLAEAGHEVVGQANNGEKAVELATSLRPDLVIMDVKMPVMDGITAAEAIGKERI